MTVREKAASELQPTSGKLNPFLKLVQPARVQEQLEVSPAITALVGINTWTGIPQLREYINAEEALNLVADPDHTKRVINTMPTEEVADMGAIGFRLMDGDSFTAINVDSQTLGEERLVLHTEGVEPKMDISFQTMIESLANIQEYTVHDGNEDKPVYATWIVTPDLDDPKVNHRQLFIFGTTREREEMSDSLGRGGIEPGEFAALSDTVGQSTFNGSINHLRAFSHTLMHQLHIIAEQMDTLPISHARPDVPKSLWGKLISHFQDHAIQTLGERHERRNLIDLLEHRQFSGEDIAKIREHFQQLYKELYEEPEVVVTKEPKEITGQSGNELIVDNVSFTQAFPPFETGERVRGGSSIALSDGPYVVARATGNSSLFPARGIDYILELTPAGYRLVTGMEKAFAKGQSVTAIRAMYDPQLKTTVFCIWDKDGSFTHMIPNPGRTPVINGKDSLGLDGIGVINNIQDLVFLDGFESSIYQLPHLLVYEAVSRDSQPIVIERSEHGFYATSVKLELPRSINNTPYRNHCCVRLSKNRFAIVRPGYTMYIAINEGMRRGIKMETVLGQPENMWLGFRGITEAVQTRNNLCLATTDKGEIVRFDISNRTLGGAVIIDLKSEDQENVTPAVFVTANDHKALCISCPSGITKFDQIKFYVLDLLDLSNIKAPSEKASISVQSLLKKGGTSKLVIIPNEPSVKAFFPIEPGFSIKIIGLQTDTDGSALVMFSNGSVVKVVY